MPKFRALIHGMNFQMRDMDSPSIQPMGFYVTAYVEAVSPEAAESASVDLLRATAKLREGVLNPPNNPPRMFVEEIEELAEWPTDCALPLSGFAFYNDTNEDEDDDPTAANRALQRGGRTISGSVAARLVEREGDADDAGTLIGVGDFEVAVVALDNLPRDR